MSAATHLWLRILALVLAASTVALAFAWDDDPALVAEPRAATEAPVFVSTPGVATYAPLFGSAGSAASSPIAGAAEGADGPPEMIGVAGRLPDDVEVLVRLPDGSSATLRQGQSAAGWTLVSAAVDRAVFERGGDRRVTVLQAP